MPSSVFDRDSFGHAIMALYVEGEVVLRTPAVVVVVVSVVALRW